MSDIGLFTGRFDFLILALIIGSPGIAIGLAAGALAWRGHRIWGALIGAGLGWGLWLLGWLYFTDNL